MAYTLNNTFILIYWSKISLSHQWTRSAFLDLDITSTLRISTKWRLQVLMSYIDLKNCYIGNLINEMNKKNSFSDSGYFLLRLPPMLCWRTRRLSTAWNRSTRLTSTKRPPSSASWGYWRRRMSPSLKRDPQGSDIPTPSLITGRPTNVLWYWYCTRQEKDLQDLFSVIWTLFLHSMMTYDVELCLSYFINIIIIDTIYYCFVYWHICPSLGEC